LMPSNRAWTRAIGNGARCRPALMRVKTRASRAPPSSSQGSAR
jgi:hypothetical protein